MPHVRRWEQSPEDGKLMGIVLISDNENIKKQISRIFGSIRYIPSWKEYIPMPDEKLVILDMVSSYSSIEESEFISTFHSVDVLLIVPKERVMAFDNMLLRNYVKDFITFPFTPEELFLRIERVLRKLELEHWKSFVSMISVPALLIDSHRTIIAASKKAKGIFGSGILENKKCYEISSYRTEMGDSICNPNCIVSTVFLSGANLELEVILGKSRYRLIVIPISEDGAVKNILELLIPL